MSQKRFVKGRVLVVGLVALLFLSAMNVSGQSDRRLGRDAGAGAEKRVALVIGNGGYKTVPLSNAVNDATDMGRALEQTGFAVTVKTDLDQKGMKIAIRQFGEAIRNGSVGLFYFAGHGVQVGGRNFLIPVDAVIEKEGDVDVEGVDLNAVLAQMEQAGNRLNIVILDACRDNPFSRGFRSATGGLAAVDAPAGTFIAYATSPGRTASDGTGRNGLYTAELLGAIRRPGLPIEEVFKLVRANVRTKSNGKQVPWDASSIEGSFFFTAGNGSQPPAANNPPATGPQVSDDGEEAAWNVVKDSKRIGEVQSFLKSYPNGRFATAAKLKMRQISEDARESNPTPGDPAESASILRRLETYKAPPYPKERYGGLLEYETYDYRLRSGTPVPPTLTDTLVCDFWIVLRKNFKLNPAPSEATEDQMFQVIEFYRSEDFSKAPGYRPWTHWNFIRGLDEAERQRLVKDILFYIRAKGVRDVNTR
jgi:hypothetical protein